MSVIICRSISFLVNFVFLCSRSLRNSRKSIASKLIIFFGSFTPWKVCCIKSPWALTTASEPIKVTSNDVRLYFSDPIYAIASSLLVSLLNNLTKGSSKSKYIFRRSFLNLSSSEFVFLYLLSSHEINAFELRTPITTNIIVLMLEVIRFIGSILDRYFITLIYPFPEASSSIVCFETDTVIFFYENSCCTK